MVPGGSIPAAAAYDFVGFDDDGDIGGAASPGGTALRGHTLPPQQAQQTFSQWGQRSQWGQQAAVEGPQTPQQVAGADKGQPAAGGSGGSAGSSATRGRQAGRREEALPASRGLASFFSGSAGAATAGGRADPAQALQREDQHADSAAAADAAAFSHRGYSAADGAGLTAGRGRQGDWGSGYTLHNLHGYSQDDRSGVASLSESSRSRRGTAEALAAAEQGQDREMQGQGEEEGELAQERDVPGLLRIPLPSFLSGAWRGLWGGMSLRRRGGTEEEQYDGGGGEGYIAGQEGEGLEAVESDGAVKVAEPEGPPRSCCSRFLSFFLVSLFVLGVGMLSTVQTSMTSRTGQHYGSFIFGSAINFVSGSATLLILVAVEAWRRKVPFVSFQKP